MNKKVLFAALIASLMSFSLVSCEDDKPDGESIFDTTEGGLDPESKTYKFDRWLQVYFNEKYNVEFRYKMQHIGTDMSYNLVPATLENAEDLALLTKYLWFDVYDELVGSDFLCLYGPKILHLIGSPAYNPANHTEILGLAEGGLKVSLFKVNELDTSNPERMNEHYFKTMHHEFSHILHQTKTYPKEFDNINTNDYEPSNWQDRNGAIVNSFGCTTTYASSQAREDFAETCANYITRSYDQWDLLLWIADRGWETTDEDDHAYAYFYYASDSDRENGIKTYVGEYLPPENNDGVFGVLNYVAKQSSGSYTYSYIGSPQAYTTVAEVEAFIEQQKKLHDLQPVNDLDNKNGKENILQKVSIVRNWFKDAWGLDLDALRDEVQRRQSSIDMDALRAQVEAME